MYALSLQEASSSSSSSIVPPLTNSSLRWVIQLVVDVSTYKLCARSTFCSLPATVVFMTSDNARCWSSMNTWEKANRKTLSSTSVTFNKVVVEYRCLLVCNYTHTHMHIHICTHIQHAYTYIHYIHTYIYIYIKHLSFLVQVVVLDLYDAHYYEAQLNAGPNKINK